MKVFAFVMCSLLAYAQSASIGVPTTLVRTPHLDSAIIQSERLGGNFAYRSVEAHSYAAVSPVVETVPTPIGVSYQEKPIFAQVTYQEPAVVLDAPAGYPAFVPAPAPAVLADTPTYEPVEVPGSPLAPAMGSPVVPFAPPTAVRPIGDAPSPVRPIGDAPSFSGSSSSDSSDDTVAIESA